MNIKILVVGLQIVASYATLAMGRIGFSCNLPDDRTCAFGCDLYSIRKTGMMKMAWFPSVACQVDVSTTSRTSKVWSMMPLRKIVPSDGGWHCSQKPRTHKVEPSARYWVEYFAESAEGDAIANVYHIFDIDAGDMFQWFGYSRPSPSDVLINVLLEGDDKPSVKDLDRVLCSSGRIGLNGGRIVLLYGLTMIANGECRLAFSVDGLRNTSLPGFYCDGGKIYESREKLKNLMSGDCITIHSSPAISIWLSDSETISARIAYDSRHLEPSANSEDDLHISLTNLLGIVEWLSKPEGARGSWQASRECSLKARRIF